MAIHNFKYILFFLILWSLSLPSFSQKDSLDLVPIGGQNYSLKLSLPRLITPIIPSIQLAFEHSDKKGRSWRHQVGKYFDFNYKDQESIEHINGIRFQTGLRKYKSKYAKSTSFKELSFDYRYLDLLIGGDFIRSNFNFQQRINYSVWQHSLSLNFIWGRTIYLGKNWHFDIGTGLGIKVNQRSYGSIPADALLSTNGNSLLWEYGQRSGWHATLSIPIIFSVGYTWW